MKLIATFLLLALPVRAQQAVSVIPIERGVLLQTDGGIVDVSGGAWLSEQELIEQGQDHADLRTQNEELRQHAPDVPYRWVLGATAVGVVVGVIIGVLSANAARKP